MRNKAVAADAALMREYTGTSASDCGIKMDRMVDNFPGKALGEITQILRMMNFHCIEKKAHRQALARAGRKALAKLAEMPA